MNINEVINKTIEFLRSFEEHKLNNFIEFYNADGGYSDYIVVLKKVSCLTNSESRYKIEGNIYKVCDLLNSKKQDLITIAGKRLRSDKGNLLISPVVEITELQPQGSERGFYVSMDFAGEIEVVNYDTGVINEIDAKANKEEIVITK